MINLTDAELATLSAMEIQAKAGTIDYWKIYSWLADTLQAKGVSGTDSTVLWLKGATEANASRGTFAELIRKYTQVQYQLRYGTALSESLMQTASNAVSQNFIEDLLRRNVPSWPKGQVPNLNRISLADARAVGKALVEKRAMLRWDDEGVEMQCAANDDVFNAKCAKRFA